jgi:hypothetical protein
VSTAAINKLEELWQDDPNATLEDVDKPGIDDEAQPTLARYEDGYHFQNVLAPLVRVDVLEGREADNLNINCLFRFPVWLKPLFSASSRSTQINRTHQTKLNR